jgi:hypothetical protein
MKQLTFSGAAPQTGKAPLFERAADEIAQMAHW